MKHFRLKLLAVAVLLLALIAVLAACGSGDAPDTSREEKTTKAPTTTLVTTTVCSACTTTKAPQGPSDPGITDPSGPTDPGIVDPSGPTDPGVVDPSGPADTTTAPVTSAKPALTTAPVTSAKPAETTAVTTTVTPPVTLAPGEGRESAIPCTEGSNAGTTKNGTTYYAFTPTESGLYHFYTTSSIDTYGQLYDSIEGDRILGADHGGTNNGDFRFSYSCVAGTTYYISVRDYVSSGSEDYVLYVEASVPGESRENAIAYTEGGISGKTVRGSIVYYAFTPEKSGIYRFYSEGTTDTYGRLYDSLTSTGCVAQNDNGSSVKNFWFTYSCTAGTTYYVAVNGCNSSSGNYTLHVMSNEDGTTFNTAYIEELDTGTAHDLTGVNVVYHAFTPKTSGTYYFYATGSLDTVGSLYTAKDTAEVAENHDDGPDLNFCLSYSCAAGTTYYVAVKGTTYTMIGEYVFWVSTTAPN